MSNPAFLVLKQTPQGVKLLPLATVNGSRGQRLSGAHLNADRVREVMDFLMPYVRDQVRMGKRPTLKEAFDAATRLYGAEAFADCAYLSAVGETPARLVIKEVR
jgi:hypothetical protein